MKKNKMKVTSNDVLSALSIRVNDLLKTTRKGTTDKTNSAYFWLFKLILLFKQYKFSIGNFLNFSGIISNLYSSHFITFNG